MNAKDVIEATDSLLKESEDKLIAKVNSTYSKAVKATMSEFKKMSELNADVKLSSSEVRGILKRALDAFEKEYVELVKPIQDLSKEAYEIGLKEASEFVDEMNIRISKIDDHLYQGGNVTSEEIPILRKNNIKYMADLEGMEDEKPVRDYLDWYKYFPLPVGTKLPNIDMKKLWELANEVQEYTEDGHNVLIHCLNGVNRSSLLVGMVLYLRGYRGSAIIRKIKKARPFVLTNKVFAKYLENLTGNNKEV